MPKHPTSKRPRRAEAASGRRRREPWGPDALRQYLVDHKLSQQDFANQIGVTRSHVAMILGGSPPSLACAVRIEEITGIRCADWVTEAAA